MSAIMGAIAVQLLLRPAKGNVPVQYKDVPLYCDNKGVLHLGIQAKEGLKEEKARFDLLHVIKTS
jgi:hypothetical protein